MGDLLIRGISDELKHRLQQEATRHGRNLSDEAKIQIQKGISTLKSTQERAGDHLVSILEGGFFDESEVRIIESSRDKEDRSPPDLR